MCRRFGVQPLPAQRTDKVGIAHNFRADWWPLNALRHPPEGDTTGWYIWSGEEFSLDPDFFLPLHLSHLDERCPILVPYLALPAGSRVLLAPGYEDVWEDESLLVV